MSRQAARATLAAVAASVISLLLPVQAMTQSSSGGSSVRIRASEAPRATAATAAATAAAREELQALEAERVKLERAVQSLTRELQLRGRDVDRPLADSLMRLRTRELQVRARTLAVARGLQQLTTRERLRVVSREAPRGWLGVSFEGGVVEETPRGAVLVAPGYPRIFTVSPGSPAEEAGLERGDRIVSIGGVDVRSQPIVLDDVFRPGQSVPIRITREGSIRDVRVRVTERPQRWIALRSMPDSAVFAGLPDWATPWTVQLETSQDWGGVMRFNFDSTRMDALRLYFDSSGVSPWIAARDAARAARTVPGMAPSAPMRVNGRASSAPVASGTSVRGEASQLTVRGSAPQVRVRVMAAGEGTAATPFVMHMGDVGYAFGARLTTLSRMLRSELNAPDGGILVLEVAPATPAERAGLRPLDVIVRADGKLVLTPTALVRLIGEKDGKSLSLELVRRRQAEEVRVVW